MTSKVTTTPRQLLDMTKCMAQGTSLTCWPCISYAGYIRFYKVSSILDVGAGTGRAMFWLQQRFPKLTIKGIEPVEALRNQGFAKGISS